MPSIKVTILLALLITNKIKKFEDNMQKACTNEGLYSEHIS